MLLFLVLCFGLVASQQCPTYVADTKQLTGLMRDVWPCKNQDSCGGQLAAGQPTPACKTAGSNWNCATDFERAVGSDSNLVQFYLDPVTRNPKLIAERGTIINNTQFNWWYKDVPNFNIPFPLQVTASNADTCNSLLYKFDSQVFYPINGKGFGNYAYDRNYHFTFEMRMRFTYQGNEKFEFVGDDDVWLFINDRLALDIGGVHPAERGYFDLTWPAGGCPAGIDYTGTPCTYRDGGPAGATFPCACVLGLKGPGNSYSFDMFYNERNTVDSTLRLTTSLLLQCPWYDHCQVCQGDGQSCCDCVQTPCASCRCDVQNGNKIYTPKVCPANPNACQFYTCRATDGACVINNRNCNDNNPCTVDSCIPASGCANPAKNCNDNDHCTRDSCSPNNGTCLNVPISCDRCLNKPPCPIPADKCDNVECDPTTGNCTTTRTVCNDNNLCTADTCNPTTGECEFVLNPCDDGNACTFDSCDVGSGLCNHTAKICDDFNACTNNTCNILTGDCNYTAIAVPVGNKCLGVYCDKTLGIVEVPTTCPKACAGPCDPELGCKECPGAFPTAAAIGIGAGVTAAIVIGVIAAVALLAGGGFGGRKAYLAYLANKQGLGETNTNPLFVENTNQGTNPMFQPKD